MDRYYWVLAGLSGVNLVVYILVAFIYRYKNLESNNGARTDADASALAKSSGPNAGAEC